MVAGLYRGHARANLTHHACAFMAKHQWHGHGQVTGNDMPVAVADPSGLHPHQHGITGNDPVKGLDREAWLDRFFTHPMLPRMLADAGFLTLHTGKYWMRQPAAAGFTDDMGATDRHGGKALAIGRETMQPIDDFLEDWSEYAPVLMEDGSIGAGAQSDDPWIEVFLDSWKGIEVQVPVQLRDDVERILGQHRLEEVLHTWPPEVDERPEPPLNVREILTLDDRDCPDLDEILFQIRQAWALELDEDPEENVDETGRRLGRTLWSVVAVVESADPDVPRAGYAMAWVTAASLGEVRRMVESRIELQDEWTFGGQWYSADRVAFDERPDELADLPPRRNRSEIHSFRIEAA